MTVPSARIALQTPSVIRMIASLLCLRESGYRLRSVPVIVTSRGIAFAATPPEIVPKVRTAGLVGCVSLETTVWSCAIRYALTTIGSTHRCGYAPCPANAFYRDRKVIAGRLRGAGHHGNASHRNGRVHMCPHNNIGLWRKVHRTGCRHRVCAARSLLCRLDHDPDIAMQSFPALLKKLGTVERGDCVDVMPAAVADTFNARRKGQSRPLLDRQSVHVVSDADGRPIMHPTDQCAHTRLHIKGLQLYAELL